MGLWHMGIEYISIKGHHTFIKRNAETGKIISKNEYDNLICTACKNMIAAELVAGAGSHNITYGTVGTNTAAPSAADTTLGTEIDRVALSSISATGAVVTARAYFGPADGNGVLKEYGLFGAAATAAADSGTMINHVVISETKTATETLTVESVITIS